MRRWTATRKAMAEAWFDALEFLLGDKYGLGVEVGLSPSAVSDKESSAVSDKESSAVSDKESFGCPCTLR